MYGTVQYSMVQYGKVWYSTVQYGTVQCSTVQYRTHFSSSFFFFLNSQEPSQYKESKSQYSMSPYHVVMYCTKGVRGQKVLMVPEFKRCKGCQGIKGAKGAWVKSSEGLLGGRVFSRTHLRSSLTPEEGPSC